MKRRILKNNFLQRVNPTSAGRRHLIKIKKNLLIKNISFFRHLLITYKRQHGRSLGKITTRHKGGGNKKLYRPLQNIKINEKALVIGTTYDPYRTALTNLCFNYTTKKFFFTLATHNVTAGALIKPLSHVADVYAGFRDQIKNFPSGSLIHNISDTLGGRAKLALAAGTYAVLLAKRTNTVVLKLPSGKKIEINNLNTATLGVSSNHENYFLLRGNAGYNRRMGKRPSVRGIAMNPVDHPHGGRTNGGRPSVSPWGWPTKNGYKLRARLYV